jgi:hypothetical protein
MIQRGIASFPPGRAGPLRHGSFRSACDTNDMSCQPKVKMYREVTMYRVT